MPFLHDRPRLPRKEEIDSLWFNIWMLLVAGLLLAFALGICADAFLFGDHANGYVATAEVLASLLARACGIVQQEADYGAVIQLWSGTTHVDTRVVARILISEWFQVQVWRCRMQFMIEPMQKLKEGISYREELLPHYDKENLGWPGYGIGLQYLDGANKRWQGRWTLMLLSATDIASVMLPWHKHEHELEVIPQSGLSVSAAVQRLKQLPSRLLKNYS